MKAAAMAAATSAAAGESTARSCISALPGASDVTWDKAPCRFCGTGCHVQVGVEDGKVVVSFEKESLFGGLMIASKGMAGDYREPGKFVEPARPTPGDRLNHFRVCGEYRKWHAADAIIG